MPALDARPLAEFLPAEERAPWLPFESLLRGAFFAVLFSYAGEGILRFGLNMAGAAPLLYVRDLILVLIVVHSALREVLERRIGVFGISLMMLAGHSAVGLLESSNPLQVAFGIKLFIPVLASMAVAPTMFRDGRFPFWILGSLWLFCAVGIIFDEFFKLPWTGLSYSLMGHHIEGNRLWWTGGVERLSGFTRFSWDAAAQIQLTGLCVVAIARKTWLKLAIWTVTGIVVFLTTTKGLIMAYVLCTICMGYGAISRRLPDIRRPLLLVMGLSCILLPFIGSSRQLPVNSRESRVLLDSLADRMDSTWPEALHIYRDHNVLLGGGIGAFGTPQQYFGGKENPGDNFLIYILNIFGPFAFLYIGILLVGSLRLGRGDSVEDRYFTLVALTLFTSGVVINVIESPFLALFLGLLLGRISTSRAASVANRV